jgi:membrane fusion protein (multidrug efflux system)
MSIHFSQSLRRLDADGSSRDVFLLLLTIGLLSLWTAWFTASHVAIYATTGAARLEVDRESHPVDVPIGGRVIAVPLTAGRRVDAGEVLLALDASPERLARRETLAKLDPAARQIRSLHEELAAQERAMAEETGSATAADDENRSKMREATAAADVATDEARRLATLQTSGLVSVFDALRAQKTAEERRSEAQTAAFSAGRLTRDLEARTQDRLARIARLRNEIAAIEGTRGEANAASERLGYEIEQRQVRAPVSGTLAEMSSLKIGNVVRAGDRICTIVPDGALKVIALFSPSVALGRIQVGQSARVRLVGFPWTQYGSASARVSHVAGELRDGAVRVELTLSSEERSNIPLQHGLPAEVDVEVERTSPLIMVLKSAGAHLRISRVTSDTDAPALP